MKRPSCFAAGTPLLTPDGSKVIESFKPGDLILARSEFEPLGAVEVKHVVAVNVHTAEVIDLFVGGQCIRSTEYYPFYVSGRGWVPACLLAPGDRLCSHDGQTLRVDALTWTGEVTTVYNVEVADHHTYFVGSPTWGFTVWAHNACIIVSGWQVKTEFAATYGASVTGGVGVSHFSSQHLRSSSITRRRPFSCRPE